MMADEYILKRNALAILMGDKVDLSPNFVSISMAIDPSSIAKFKDLNFTCDRHIDLIKEIPAEDVAPVQKWIPVTERLPEEKDYYLVYAHGVVGTAYYGSKWWTEDPRIYEPQITHWMTMLPEPTEEGE